MRFVFIAVLFLLRREAYSQLHPERVNGLPTNELNDLHVDKNGYLWIAHGLGISRYDGLNFTNYSHPDQISLPTADIAEDGHGRIWYHNFSGQVFYIEKGLVHRLESYDYKKENQNPRMALFGNELLITSYKGLYVCNTENFTTHFLPFRQVSPVSLVSLAVLRDKAIVFDGQDWYTYNHGLLLRTAVASPFRFPADNFLTLQPATCNDTLYLAANPSGILFKLRWEQGRLRFLASTEYHDFIDAVSVHPGPWVHTRNQSINLGTGATVDNYDLMDAVCDSEGNTWFGSRRGGLLVSYRPGLWRRTPFQIGENSYIRSLNASAGYFFAGTQKGSLFRFKTDSSRFDWKHELFNGLGSIDFIRYVANDLFIVGSSTETYIVNAKEKKIQAPIPLKAILDVDYDGSSFFVATATGLYIMPYPAGAAGKQEWLQQKRLQYPFVNWTDTAATAYLLIPQRTRSVRFDSLHATIYAATKNGLYEVNHKTAQPVLINGREVFATSVAYKQARLYVSTIDDGLWLIEGRKVQHYTAANALASNTIIRVKLTEDHLWLFERSGIQVLDIHTGRILQNIDLPKIEGANVLDVAESGEVGYIATANGVYKVPFRLAAQKPSPKGFLDYVIANGRDTMTASNVSLPYQSNDVQFFFSSPAFYDPETVSFRYRLVGADNAWRATYPGERMIRYSALPAGDYEFDFYVVDNKGLQQAQVIRFPFSIQKPWWRTAWFLVLLNMAAVGVGYLVIRNRINQKLRLELMRRDISNDLHDDIGATLSSVNFYVDLAQAEKNNTDYLQYIRENVNHVINSLDDLVWSINPRNDSTGQFVDRMKNYAVPLLKAARIQCQFQIDPKLLHLRLDLLTKRHLYLLFKEMVNNVAKHANGQNCIVQLLFRNSRLCLTVTDDGRGFDPDRDKQLRHGLLSMQERARKLKGNMEIRSAPGKGSRVDVCIPV